MATSEQQIKTEKVSINELFRDFWLRIPEYQRSFKWGKEEIDNLLDDIWHARDQSDQKEYFLGSIVLQRNRICSGNLTYDCFDILDGQQRLTTLLLLIAVLRDLTKNQELKKWATGAIHQAKNEFSNQPERIRIDFPIRNDASEFIVEFIKTDGGTSREIDIQRMTESPSQKPGISVMNMAKAVLFLRKKLKERTEDDCSRLATFLSNKVMVIYVASDSLDDAFRLFTILNNRGLPLTSSDILKSINVGEINDPKKRENWSAYWEELEGEFGPEEFDRFIGHLRTIVVKEKARENLLKEFEKIYKDNLLQKGEATFRMIKTYRDHYANLIWQENEDLKGDCRFRNLIVIMAFSLSTDWIPPLLYFVQKFGCSAALDFLCRLESKYLADWVLQETPTNRISAMNALLRAIEKAETARDVINEDSIFKYERERVRQSIDGPIYDRSFGRYLMLRLEWILNDREKPFAPFNRITVEHVLPQKPAEASEWRIHFTQEQRDHWVDRIANLVLLGRIKNSALGNMDFKQKQQAFFQREMSLFPNVAKVMSLNEWTPSTLEGRQAELVALMMRHFK